VEVRASVKERRGGRKRDYKQGVNDRIRKILKEREKKSPHGKQHKKPKRPRTKGKGAGYVKKLPK